MEWLMAAPAAKLADGMEIPSTMRTLPGSRHFLSGLEPREYTAPLVALHHESQHSEWRRARPNRVSRGTSNGLGAFVFPEHAYLERFSESTVNQYGFERALRTGTPGESSFSIVLSAQPPTNSFG